MIDIDFSKYEKSVLDNINSDNMMNIISFLLSMGCDFVEELLDDYLDIFQFEYDDFVNKYNRLNKKYNNNLINEIRDNMNILEELYY